MFFRTISFAILAITLLMTTTLAQAAPKKCPPGSYWDQRDGKCIYGNGN